MRSHIVLGAVGVLFLIGSALAVTGGRGISQQGSFLQSGTGAQLRTIESKERDWVSTKDFNGADFCARLTQAIAAVGSGGVIHAEGDDAPGGGGWTCASGITISTPGITVFLPSSQINMGTNQWIIPVGVHNVSLIGTSSFGVASVQTTTGTSISYTGTGAAVQVGDSTSDTWGFLLQDVAINVTGAGTAAIGIQLNRCGRFQIYRQRIELLIAANTQKGIDLEGFTNYTGGLIYHPWISNGGTGIYFGKNANWNEVIAGDFPMTAVGTGIAFQFAGAAGGLADGNFIYGADVENCLRPLDFDYASNNQILGLRSEACTTLVTLSANSVQNQMSTNGTTAGITDNGTNNAIQTTINPIFTQTLWNLKNATDAASEIRMGAGSASDQYEYLTFNNRLGATQWQLFKDPTNGLNINHTSTAVGRFSLGAANTFLDAEGSGVVLLGFNSGAGVRFGDAAGNAVFGASTTGLRNDDKGFKHKRVAVGCTTGASIGAACTSGALAWTTAFADANYTIACTLTGPTGQPHISSVAQSAASFTVTIAADTAVGATGTVDCIAVHD